MPAAGSSTTYRSTTGSRRPRATPQHGVSRGFLGRRDPAVVAGVVGGHRGIGVGRAKASISATAAAALPASAAAFSHPKLRFYYCRAMFIYAPRLGNRGSLASPVSPVHPRRKTPARLWFDSVQMRDSGAPQELIQQNKCCTRPWSTTTGPRIGALCLPGRSARTLNPREWIAYRFI
jgi:hypothetical protein